MGWERDYESWRDSFHTGGGNWEAEERMQNYYERSKAKLQMAEENGYLITRYGQGCCDACDRCKNLHAIGMRDETDDIELMYCSKPQCGHAQRYMRKEEERLRAWQETRQDIGL